jgi:L-iditol 2-dehydrogenase
MKAVVLYDRKDGCVELRDVPRPQIKEDEVLVQVSFVGICGSDIHIYHNEVTYQVLPPLILGHEFSGVVVEKGKRVTTVDIGDQVTAETHAYICGSCQYCHSGQYNLCPSRRGYGFGVDGAFAEYVTVPERILHHIPEGVTMEEAAVTEPACVAYNALVEKTTIRPGDLVVILGPGPIGLLCLEMAQLAGAGRTVVSGVSRDAARLELASDLGADHIVDAETADPVALVRELSNGAGADIVVDAAGPSHTLRQSLDMVRRNGQITKIGWGPDPVNFSLDPIIEKCITLQGSFSHTWPTWERCLQLIALGRLRIRPLISHQLPLTQWREAFQMVEDATAVKVLLHP